MAVLKMIYLAINCLKMPFAVITAKNGVTSLVMELAWNNTDDSNLLNTLLLGTAWLVPYSSIMKMCLLQLVVYPN